MATFAQQPQDDNLVTGWNVQGNFTGNGATGFGTPGPGFAQPAVAPISGTYTSALQGGAGFPNPPKAEDIGSENDGAYNVSILTNPGYADGNTIMTGTLAAPSPTTTGVQNPYGMNATLTIVYGATGTTAQVAPYAASAAAATFGATQPVAASANTVIAVPPAGWVKLASIANLTSVVWTPVN